MTNLHHEKLKGRLEKVEPYLLFKTFIFIFLSILSCYFLHAFVYNLFKLIIICSSIYIIGMKILYKYIEE
jgi:hypothetical protein